MAHPLLHHEQTHAIVHQFYALCMSEGVKLEMKEISCLIAKLIFFNERVQCSGDVFGIQGIAVQEALTTVVTCLALECWKEPPLGVFFRGVLLLHPCNLGENDGCDICSSWYFASTYVGC